jgi:AraC family transcriptional regulator
MHLCNPAQDVHLALADYPAGEGPYGDTDALILYLCVDGGGLIHRAGTHQRFQGTLVPHSIGIGLPASDGVGFWPAARLLAIGFTGRHLDALASANLTADRLIDLGGRLHSDPLLEALMVAMWREAEVFSLTSAFVDESAELMLRRLAMLQSNAPTARPIRPLTTAQVKRVTDYIEAHLGDDIQVAELAAISCISRAHFSRVFKAATGKSPYAYISERRILRAEALLSDGLDILSVAYAVGFHSPSQFAAAFRRHRGVSPSAWRRVRRSEYK